MVEKKGRRPNDIYTYLYYKFNIVKIEAASLKEIKMIYRRRVRRDNRCIELIVNRV